MSTIKLEIKGNFLKITDNINDNDEILISGITKYFFSKNDTLLNLRTEQGTNQVTYKYLISTLVDSTDTPFASLVALENFLSENLGDGGITIFTGLTDTPSSYSGQANKKVIVNSEETALEFADDTPVGGLTVIQNHSIVNLVSNTWRGHNNFGTIWLTSSPDTSYGTGTTPTKSGFSFQNTNCLYVRDKQQLTSLVFNCRVTTNAKNIDIIVYSFDYNDDRQSELNEQILVQETMVLTGTSNSIELNVLPHTLSSNSVIYVFYKHSSGTLSALRGVMLNYKFD